MRIPGLTPSREWALKAALVFFIVSHPMTYRIVNELVYPILGYTATPSGAPTTLGLIIHSAVFGLVACKFL